MTQPLGPDRPSAATVWAEFMLYLVRGIPREGRNAYHARAALRALRRGQV